MNENRMKLVIDVDDKAAKGRVDSFNKSLDNIEHTAVRATGKVSGGFDNITASITKAAAAGSGLATVGTMVGAALGGSLTYLLTQSLRLSSAMEQARNGFTTMLGSSEAALAHIRELQKFAATTPFNFNGLREQSQFLQAVGFQAKEVIPLIKGVGEALAAQGKGDDVLQRVLLQFGQIKSVGKAALEDLKPIAQAGVPVFDILSKAIAKPGEALEETQKRLRDLLEKGLLPAQGTIDVLVEGFNSRFAGALDKQSQTIAGKWSNLMDTLEQLGTEFGDVLAPAALEVLSALAPLLENVKELIKEFNELPRGVKIAVGLFVGLVAAIGPVLLALGSMAQSLVFINQLLGMSSGAFSTAAAAATVNTVATSANAAATFTAATAHGAAATSTAAQVLALEAATSASVRNTQATLLNQAAMAGFFQSNALVVTGLRQQATNTALVATQSETALVRVSGANATAASSFSTLSGALRGSIAGLAAFAGALVLFHQLRALSENVSNFYDKIGGLTGALELASIPFGLFKAVIVSLAPGMQTFTAWAEKLAGVLGGKLSENALALTGPLGILAKLFEDAALGAQFLHEKTASGIKEAKEQAASLAQVNIQSAQSRMAAEVSVERLRQIQTESATARFRRELEENQKRQAEEEAKKKAAQEAAQVNEQSHNILMNAMRGEVEGVAKVIIQYQEYQRDLGKTAEARRNLAKAQAIAIDTSLLKEMQRAWKASVDADAAANREAISTYKDQVAAKAASAQAVIQIDRDTRSAMYEGQLAELERAKTAELGAIVERSNASVQQKVAAEEQKLQIELSYMQQRYVLEQQHMLDVAQEDLDQFVKTEQAKIAIGQSTQAILDAGREAREANLTVRLEALARAHEAAKANITQQTRNRELEMYYDQNQKVFDDFKRQAEGVFDQMLTKGGGFFKTLGNLFKTTMLTVLKEIVSSNIAKMMLQLVGGSAQGVSTPTTRLAGQGGLASVFGALAGFGGFAPTSAVTPPFVASGGAPSAAQPATAPYASMLGLQGTQLSRQAALMSGLGSMAGMGLLSYGIGNRGRGAAGSLSMVGGGALTAASIAPMLGLSTAGMAWLGAGAGLAGAGLMRGGASGLMMTTAGGALIGLQLGGPIGAAIGAGVGAIAGIVRLFMKGAEDKMRSKIKELYRVDIDDKNLLKQFVSIAKQNFGGNIDLAIRSPQIRELIELYSMHTGKPLYGSTLAPAPAPSYALAGAGISAVAPSNNNRPYLMEQSPTAPVVVGSQKAQATTQASAPAGPTYLTLLVNGEPAASALRGEVAPVIIDSPGLVEQAVNKASRAGTGRYESMRMQLAPSVIMD